MEMINGDGIVRVAYHYSSTFPALSCARDDRNSWIAGETRVDAAAARPSSDAAAADDAAEPAAPSAARWRDEWREYAVEIGPDHDSRAGGGAPVRFAIDGVELPLAVTYLDGLLAEGLAPDEAGAPRFADVAYYLLLNTAVGRDGTWSGAPDARTAPPVYHYVDYVRVARPAA